MTGRQNVDTSPTLLTSIVDKSISWMFSCNLCACVTSTQNITCYHLDESCRSSN